MISPCKLIDYFFAIQTSKINGQYQSSVYFTFPPLKESHHEALNNIIPFCYPASYSDEEVADKEDSVHDFVLTDEKGRLLCPKYSQDLPQIENLCFCLIGSQPRFSTFRTLLQIFNQLLSNPTTEMTAEYFMHFIYHQIILPPASPIVLELALPFRNHLSLYTPIPAISLPLLDFQITSLLPYINISLLVDIFALLLLEKSILLCSKSFSFLTRYMELCLSFLYPLQWEMVYIPVVPEALSDLIHAPTPFFMGADSGWVLEKKNETFEGGHFVVIDLDFGDFYDFYPAEVSPVQLIKQLPLRKELLKSLHTLTQPKPVSEFDTFNDVKEVKKEQVKDDQFRMIFFDWFLELFQGFRQFYRTDGRFEDFKWLQSKSETSLPFLSSLAKTSVFINFVDSKSPDADLNRSGDLFDYYILEKEEKKPHQHKLYKKKESDRAVLCAELSSKFLAQMEQVRDALILDFRVPLLDKIEKGYKNVFQLEVFLAYQEMDIAQHHLNDFIKKLNQISSQHVDYCWMKAYAQEKLGGSFLTEAFKNYALVLLSKLKTLRIDSEVIERLYRDGNGIQSDLDPLVWKLKRLLTKITVDEAFLKTCFQQEEPLIQLFSQFIPRPNQNKMLDVDFSMQRRGSKQHSRNLSQNENSLTDRLVLNCSPLKQHEHIDSNEQLYDDQISEIELSLPEKELLQKPLVLSLHLLELMTQMFKVLSLPPEDIEHGWGEQSAEKISVKSLHAPLFDFFHSKKKIKQKSPFSMEFFQQLDSSEEYEFKMKNLLMLKEIKKMPTFEAFKKMIVLLRFLRLDELKNEHEKISFWTNIRHCLLYLTLMIFSLHALVEFGIPMNQQHRISFLYHKPVYMIYGYLFSINEITFGILKANLPLPQHLSQSTGTGSNFMTVQQDQGSVGLLVKKGVAETKLEPVNALFGSSESANKEHKVSQQQPQPQQQSNNHFSMSKIPMKFSPNDPRFGFRVTLSWPILDFVLFDGTKHGPTLTVLKSEHLKEQLYQQSILYLNKRILTGKEALVQAQQLNLVISSKKKVILLPQSLQWNMKSLISVHSVEQLILYFYYAFPESKLSHYLHCEHLIIQSDKTKEKFQGWLFESDDKIQQRIEVSKLNLDKCELHWVEHDWEFEIRMLNDFSDIL